MNRMCFTLRVKPEMLDEYKAHHRDVWPDMLHALSRHGWHNYSLFLRDDGLLIGYFETPGTLDDAVAGMAGEPVNDKWQELMAPYFEGAGGHADSMMTALEEVFHLP
jgi:L-rhamnose mutarotase